MTSEQIAGFLASSTGVLVFTIAAIWAMIWKGIALWKAAQRSEKAWFVIMLILNTVGILEIIYIFIVAKDEKKCC